jgi:DNA-binding MarR family transcriptional regulator
MIKEPKYRKQLNNGQLEVLRLLLKFRFGTTDLLARGLGKKNGTVIKSRLAILREQGYIDRHYGSADRLQGRHAVYYLLPKAVRVLEKVSDVEKALKRAYKAKNASRQFIDHNLSIFTACYILNETYEEALRFFTKVDLAAYNYFPQPLPDAFMSFKRESGTNRFFMEVFEAASPPFTVNRRIKQLIDYYEGSGWEATDSDFPAILFICETPALQNRIEKRIISSIKNADDADGLIFATANWQTLTTKDAKAWRVAGDDELVSLAEL